MLETRNLDKSFGAVHVTRDVSLKLERGERRVILGPNGAGKTTLFNQLVGELTPDSGSVHLAGEDVTALPVAKRARRGLSRSYQKNTLFDGLSVEENLGLAAAVHTGNATQLWSDSLAKPEVREIVEEVASQVNLMPFIHAKVSEISYGVRRQLEVGVALATRPLVLLMDEPCSALDPIEKDSDTLLSTLLSSVFDDTEESISISASSTSSNMSGMPCTDDLTPNAESITETLRVEPRLRDFLVGEAFSNKSAEEWWALRTGWRNPEGRD